MSGTPRARFERMPVLTALFLAAMTASPAAPAPASSQSKATSKSATSKSSQEDAGAGERESRKLYLRARAAVADGQYREGLDLYRKVIEKMPADAVVRYEYAQLLRDLNVQEEAIKQAAEAVRIDPKMAEAHRLLGTLELAAGEKDPARMDRGIAELREARRLAPGDIPTAAALARALLARGKPGEA